MKKLHALLLTLAGMFILSMPASAEQSKTFGNYTIHYNAINTQMLDASVAKSYQIKRSRNRALLTISVLENVLGTTAKPVKAKVTAIAKNLSDQLRKITLREIEDAGAIYYIGEVPIRNEETLKFEIRVRPTGVNETYTVTFQQQFFTE